MSLREHADLIGVFIRVNRTAVFAAAFIAVWGGGGGSVVGECRGNMAFTHALFLERGRWIIGGAVV